jgi:RNA polymerase sigma-70 factor (ECF subfamily)
MGDDHLVSKAQQGDSAALDTLFRREWKPVYALIYRSVRNRAEAEDLTQDAFLRTLKAFGRYQDTGVPFRAFLATVARNLVRSHWRRQSLPAVDLDNSLELISKDAGPDIVAIAGDARRHLDAALAQLPDDYQTVIRLRVYEDRTTAEVAVMMNRSPGAIRVLQHRALIALRARLPEGMHRG